MADIADWEHEVFRVRSLEIVLIEVGVGGFDEGVSVGEVPDESIVRVFSGSANDVSLKGQVLIVSSNAESDIGDINSVGILGSVGSGWQLELAGIVSAGSESREITEGSSDSDDLVVFVSVLVLVVGENG